MDLIEEKEKSIEKIVCKLIDENNTCQQKRINMNKVIENLKNEIKNLKNENNKLINSNINLKAKISALKFMARKYHIYFVI